MKAYAGGSLAQKHINVIVEIPDHPKPSLIDQWLAPGVVIALLGLGVTIYLNKRLRGRKA